MKYPINVFLLDARPPWWQRWCPPIYIRITHPRLGRLVVHLFALWIAPLYGCQRWFIKLLQQTGRDFARRGRL